MMRNEGQLIHPDKLCSLADAAERLDIPRNRMQRWAERRRVTGFPEPIYAHLHTQVYSWPAIKRWVDTWYSTRRRDG